MDVKVRLTTQAVQAAAKALQDAEAAAVEATGRYAAVQLELDETKERQKREKEGMARTSRPRWPRSSRTCTLRRFGIPRPPQCATCCGRASCPLLW